MTLRTKLLIYFFSVSSLILIVGMIFYVQLSNLIGPLTPQSVPQSVEQLTHIIDKNEIKNSLIYRQLLVEYNLENYVFTNQLLSLQKYYRNNSLLLQQLAQAKIVNPLQWGELNSKLQAIDTDRAHIISLMHANDALSAKQLIQTKQFQQSLKDFKEQLIRYFYQPAIHSNEAAVVTVKLATKHSYAVLHQSLNTTLIIFIDAILVSMILIFFSVRSLVNPIKLLRNNIEKMTLENLSISIFPQLLRLKGEVGDLARSFNALFSKLRASTVLRNELLAEIRRHKDTELKLEKTAAHLRESLLDLDQFSYAASHDLRSPLRSIEHLVSWIEEDCYELLPDESRKHFALIRKRVNRLDALIAGMLEYSRAGRALEELEPVDLNQLIAESIDSLAPPAHIKVTIEANMPLLKAHKAKITQVFLNLISNAIKYNDKTDGYVHIGYKTVENYYQFYVKDNGCGIEPQYHQKVFEIFQKLQSRDMIEGSGIGLAIVKKIVEKQGGKVWVNSIPQKGSTFYFTWPR